MTLYTFNFKAPPEETLKLNEILGHELFFDIISCNFWGLAAEMPEKNGLQHFVLAWQPKAY
jgi:hypothetical protein